jgi:glycosyltransferase involved in cell wall biosynthesis
MGLSGIQRTLKFIKYLPEYGWSPTVLTVAPHAYFAYDDSFMEELRDRPVEIWRTDPGKVFSLLKKRRTVSLDYEWLRKLVNRMSQMIFIPDNKIGWKKQALELLAGKDLTRFDAVFSTAPPFTDHLLGVDIKHRYGLPLVVDFRDAWIEYPYHRYWTRWHREQHEKLESRVISSADAVVVTNGHVRDLMVARYAASLSDRTFVITQGYDPDDFARPVAIPSVDPAEVNFVYTGVFYEDRDPLMLYRALATIRNTRPEIYRRMKFYMVGYMQEEYRRMAESIGVADRLVYCGYVDHPVAIAWLRQADIAWFNIGARHKGYQTVSPGKVFEYLGSLKPILAIVPENDIRTMLSRFDHTFILDPEDQSGLERTLVELVRMKDAGTLPAADPDTVSQFSRRKLTGELAQILERVGRGGGASP